MNDFVARIEKRKDSPSFRDVACGRCGQRVGGVSVPTRWFPRDLLDDEMIDGPVLEETEDGVEVEDLDRERSFLIGFGWKFESGVWEPTRRHLQERRDAGRRQGSEWWRSGDEAYRLRANLFAQEPKRNRVAGNEEAGKQAREPGFRLPTRVRCPRCNQINHVDDPRSIDSV